VTTTRIWLNRWFSSGWNVIRLIREGGRPVEVWATADDPRSIVLAGADHAGQEPALSGDAYVDWALGYCREHRIEAFLPLHRLAVVAGAADEFAAIGTRLMVCGPKPTIDLLDDKVAVADVCEEHGLAEVPVHEVVGDLDAFRESRDRLRSLGYRVCMKPVIATGGEGFRILDEGDPAHLVTGAAGWRMGDAAAERALAASDPFPRLIVAEYLDGPEWSIDCLADRGRMLAAIPRRKQGGRVQVLDDEPGLVQMATEIAAHFGLSFLFNVQVRAAATGWPAKLLEVNPRPAAGSIVSSASGVNLPAKALDLLLDGTVEIPTPHLGIAVSRIEVEVPVGTASRWHPAG
jgi:hypothetical protein